MSRQDQYAAHNVIAAITAERDAALAAKEAAEARARERAELLDDADQRIRETREQSAIWNQRYDAERARAERAEAQVGAVEAVHRQGDTPAAKRFGGCLSCGGTWPCRTVAALWAAVAPSEEPKPFVDRLAVESLKAAKAKFGAAPSEPQETE